MATAYEITTDDGILIKGNVWKTEEELKGVVCIVHGLGEHHRRYEHIAKSLNEIGFNVYAYDQRGHGISGGKKGHSPSQNHLHEDLKLNINKIKQENPDLPFFIYGHSFGGNVVTSYLLNRDVSGISGAIISAPWFKLAFEPAKTDVLLGRLMSKI